MINLADIRFVLNEVKKIKLVRVYEFPDRVQVTKTTTHYERYFYSIAQSECERLQIVSIKSIGKGKFEIIARMTIYEQAHFESFSYEE